MSSSFSILMTLHQLNAIPGSMANAQVLRPFSERFVGRLSFCVGWDIRPEGTDASLSFIASWHFFSDKESVISGWTQEICQRSFCLTRGSVGTYGSLVRDVTGYIIRKPLLHVKAGADGAERAPPFRNIRRKVLKDEYFNPTKFKRGAMFSECFHDV